MFLEISQNLQENTCVRVSSLAITQTRPGPWTQTLKNLDLEKAGPRKTWTKKKLDPEKDGINIGLKFMSDFRELCFIKTMHNVIYCSKVRVLTDI